MSHRVFISYRSTDHPAIAEWLFRLLAQDIGDKDVFWDRDGLERGDEFWKNIQAAIDSATVFIVLIGPQWNSTTLEGHRRLDDPKDYVRREVEQALASREADPRHRILPVLFDGASFPKKEELPDSLQSLRVFDNGGLLKLPYENDLEKIVQSVVSILEATDPTPVEEKWILQQISHILASDKHRIKQIGSELEKHFKEIVSAPTSERSLARVLYTIGPAAVRFLSPLGINDAQINSLLKLLATHWINTETARDLHEHFVNASRGLVASIECGLSEFTPEESLLKASQDAEGWPTVLVNPPDVAAEIVEQVHAALLEHFRLPLFPKSTHPRSKLPPSKNEERRRICEMMEKHLRTKGYHLPVVLQMEHWMALDQDLIHQLRIAFPPLHILVTTPDPDELKTAGSFISISKPADTEVQEQDAFEAYSEAKNRLRRRNQNS